MKPENRFRLGVHKFLPQQLHHEKMSNPYSSGTADDWYSGTKTDLWIEYKFLARVPQRANVWLTNPNVKTPMLTYLQADWLAQRYAEGRNIWVIIGCPTGGVILRDLKWANEITHVKFKACLIPREDIADEITKFTMR